MLEEAFVADRVTSVLANLILFKFVGALFEIQHVENRGLVTYKGRPPPALLVLVVRVQNNVASPLEPPSGGFLAFGDSVDEGFLQAQFFGPGLNHKKNRKASFAANRYSLSGFKQLGDPRPLRARLNLELLWGQQPPSSPVFA